MLIALVLAGVFEFNALDQKLQLCHVKRLFFSLPRVVIKSPLFQSLGPQAVPTTIKIEDFDMRLTLVDKDKKSAA